jgi:chromosomal replication initiation ATPase DnaA
VSILLTTVATEVAGEFGSKLSAILAPTRGRPEDARSRAIAMHVYSVVAPHQPCCMTRVGDAFGRDRTTVRHAYKRVYDWQDNEDFEERLKQVIERVKARA